jgi:UDP-N-acetylmuramoylalanine--D-glutamate ligase
VSLDLRHPLPGKRALVVGAARSGVAAARLLRRHGVEVTACDRRAEAEVGEAARALAADGVTCTWGRDDPALLDGHEFLVWSPGIPIEHPLAAAALAAQRPVIGELELGYRASRAPFVCITGTNGKSTTTDLVGALLRAAGREVEVCGNIGRALCEVAERVSPTGLLVVEVSSFQLETVDRLRPSIATWLNLTPDHLDRHHTLAAYGAMKQRLFARQTEEDWAILNADDPEVASRRTGDGAASEFSVTRPVDEGAFFEDGAVMLSHRGGHERLMRRDEVLLPGPHNLANVLAALATVLSLEPSADVLRQVLRTYRGLEHRLEPAGEVAGVRFVNDSKATNTDSLRVALQSFPEPVVLIAGGRDKGQDFRPLAPLVQRAVRHLVLIGEGAETLAKAWPEVRQERAASLAAAVRAAWEAARGGLAERGPAAEGGGPAAGGYPATVLLSPGCASFDMFRDYEDRGRRFKEEVARLAAKGVTA